MQDTVVVTKESSSSEERQAAPQPTTTAGSGADLVSSVAKSYHSTKLAVNST